MKKSLLESFRLCLKQVYKIKQKDQQLFKIILQTVRERDPRRTRHQANDTLLGLAELLEKANSDDKVNKVQEQKSIIKTVRIFTNNSHFVNLHLMFRPNLQTNAVLKVKQDIQYQELTQKDKNFVLNVISKICDKKPVMKYKTVGVFLKSIQSQKEEVKEQDENFILKNEHKGKSQWQWAYKQLYLSKNVKLEAIVQEIYDQRLFLV